MRAQQEYPRTLLEMGFVQGLSTACVFRHPGRNIDMVVHGDDFTILGTHDHVIWVKEGLAAKYELKLRGIMGPQESRGTVHEMTILNRIVRLKTCD